MQILYSLVAVNGDITHHNISTEIAAVDPGSFPQYAMCKLTTNICMNLVYIKKEHVIRCTLFTASCNKHDEYLSCTASEKKQLFLPWTTNSRKQWCVLLIWIIRYFDWHWIFLQRLPVSGILLIQFNIKMPSYQCMKYSCGNLMVTSPKIVKKKS